jgi:hypothetical protein
MVAHLCTWAVLMLKYAYGHDPSSGRDLELGTLDVYVVQLVVSVVSVVGGSRLEMKHNAGVQQVVVVCWGPVPVC